MKKFIKIIIIFVLGGLVFAAISLIKIKNVAAQRGPDPLTFYCQLDEEFVQIAFEKLAESIAGISAQLYVPIDDGGGGGGDGDGTPPPPNPGALAWPVSNPVVGQPFCQYCGGGWHGGIDLNFGNSEGTPIYAAADGIVTRANYLCSDPYGHLGNYVSIQHEIQGQTYTTDYFHLSSISVSVKDIVTQGKQIGTMGNTCTGWVHLHFALRQGTGYAYVNPCLFLPAGAEGSQCLAGIGCQTEPATCSGP
jgi:murein DD-endopeptidase MepM/ murein hydrolase activator NlpD